MVVECELWLRWRPVLLMSVCWCLLLLSRPKLLIQIEFVVDKAEGS